MKYMETHLKINLPKINITKISGIIPVPQKSLSKLKNASPTLKTPLQWETVKYQHVLLMMMQLAVALLLNKLQANWKRNYSTDHIFSYEVGSLKGLMW